MRLFVLGMHRSGTSALTRALAEMGCHVGQDLLPSSASNPAGYWELRKVQELNDRVLEACGARWYDPAPLDLAMADRERFESEAREALAELEGRRPWAVKDPRLCLTLPLWLTMVEKPVCVLIYRHPLEVARSLEKRDGFAVPFGITLWQRYMSDLLRHTAGLPRLLVSHRRLIEDPAAELNGLARGLERLGCTGLEVPSAERLSDIIEPGLYRQRDSGDELLDPAQCELASALMDGSALGPDSAPALSPAGAALLEGYGRLAREREELSCRCERLEDDCDRLEDACDYWVRWYEAQMQGMLRSRTWRWGRRIAGLLRAVRGNQKQGTPEEMVRRTRRSYEGWRKGEPRPRVDSGRAGSSVPDPPPARGRISRKSHIDTDRK